MTIREGFLAGLGFWLASVVIKAGWSLVTVLIGLMNK